MKTSSESPHHSDCEARLIVENMPGFAWSADQDGTLRYVNQRFVEYTGKRIEDFSRAEGAASFGRTGVLHPDDVADTLKVVSHSVATGDPYVVEHRVRRFDGTYRWFRVSRYGSAIPGARRSAGTAWTSTSMTRSGRTRRCATANSVSTG